MKTRNQMIKKLSVSVFSMIALAALGLSQAWAYEKEAENTIYEEITSTSTIIILENDTRGYEPNDETSANVGSVDENSNPGTGAGNFHEKEA